MKTWIPLLATLALTTAGCSISPIVTEPTGDSNRYSDCRRAAKDYCRDALGSADEELRKCTAKATYECISNGSP